MAQEKSRTRTNDIVDIVREYRWTIGLYLFVILAFGIIVPLVICKPFHHQDIKSLKECLDIFHLLAGWFSSWIAFFTIIAIAVTALLAIRQLKAASYSQVYSRTDTALSLLLNENVKLERLYYNDHQLKNLGDDAFHFADSTRLAVNMLFTLFENIYYHHEKFHVLEDEDWNSWKLSIKWLFSIPYVQECWQRKEAGSYTPEFVEEIKNLTGIKMASKVLATIPTNLNDNQNPR